MRRTSIRDGGGQPAARPGATWPEKNQAGGGIVCAADAGAAIGAAAGAGAMAV